MTAETRTAIVVGVLFIVATVLYILGDMVSGPILRADDALQQVHQQSSVLMGGILIELVGVLAIPLIPVALYPILKRHDETMTLGYLVFRTLEAMLILLSIVGALSLIGLSQGYAGSAGAEAAYFSLAGETIQSASEWAFSLSVLVFAIDAMMLNWVFLRSGLVPRVISVWGFAAAAWLLLGMLLIPFELFPQLSQGQLEVVFATAIAVNEMVLAAWLILRGFNPAAAGADEPSSAGSVLETVAIGEAS